VNAKLPCPCGSLVSAGQCCHRREGDAADVQRAKKRERVKRQKPKGFPITSAQLRHSSATALGRLLRFLKLEEPPRTFEGLARVLNEDVTVLKRAHIAVNRKTG
jgi:hypothetical protein